MVRRKADEKKEPDQAAARTAGPDRAHIDAGKVADARPADKVPTELATAYGELARLDGVLSGAHTLAAWTSRMLQPHLERDTPALTGDDIGQLLDATESIRGALGTGREHVGRIRNEVNILKARFVGAPSRSVSLSALMGGLARLDDSALDVASRVVMHLAAEPLRCGR